MPRTDLPLDALQDYRSASVEPADFDDFWRATLAEQSGPPQVQVVPVATRLRHVEV